MSAPAAVTPPGADPRPGLLRAEDVAVHFSRRVRGRLRTVHAVDDFSLEVGPGETVGLVGESGCGKSTVGRAVLGAVPVTHGSVTYRGRDITRLKGRQWRQLRRDVQLVFQDPYSALNPKQTIREVLAEPLVVHKVARGAELVRRTDELLDLVGLPRSAASKYPHAFSGGQRQRIVIGRALALHPSFVVADEATSALDVSIQAQIIKLMQRLQEELGLAYLFISHNLAVVRHISDRVAIMYLGRIVEVGSRQEIYANPTHPYTQALISAVPVPDPTARREKQVLSGDLPSALDPPPGCRFSTRCPVAVPQCSVDVPPLRERTPTHRVACWVQ